MSPNLHMIDMFYAAYDDEHRLWLRQQRAGVGTGFTPWEVAGTSADPYPGRLTPG
jgi:hypothetical protein